MSTRIGVLGTGGLADALARLLAVDSRPQSIGEASIDCDILVATAEWSDRDTLTKVNQDARGAPVRCLFVCQEPRAVVVGPWSLPKEIGCHHCVQARRNAARELAGTEQKALWDRFLDGRRPMPRQPLVPPVAATVAALVKADVDRLADGQEPFGGRAVHFVDVATGTVARHRFLPDPCCPVCGDLPPDTAERAVLTLAPRPKDPRAGDRVRWLVGEHERLKDRYVDPETGLVAAVVSGGTGPTVTAVATLGAVDCHETSGYGSGLDPSASEVVAIAEVVERLGGQRPGARRTMVRASFHELGPEQALDPRSLGLPTPEQIAASNGEFVAYDPELVHNWVYGFSFRRQQPILVPERYTYYGMHGADPQFAFECSNGCALGGCLEEAVLYGILETAERDAFLATWYARLPVPRIDPYSVRDPLLRLLIARLEAQTGCRLDVFDVTMPEGIPCWWLMLVDVHDRPDHFKVLCGARSGLDPEAALSAGVRELASMATETFDEERRQRAREMLADPGRVVEMEDHALLYNLPEAFPRLDFLYASDRIQTLAEAFPAASRRQPSADLTDDLHDVVGRYLAGGLDVIVVDQTTLEHRAADLSCVKVIIPGMLPMTFGHRNRRVHGMSRIYQLPVQLGYRSRPLTDAEINPHPHPFP